MPTSSTRTALIVNDDPDQAQYYRALLERSGFVPTIARDGVDGLEEARRCVPDVIVSDVNMPRMDGFEFCRALRGDECLRDIPVLLVTALGKGSDGLVEGLSAGADDFIEVPYDATRLVARVSRLVERRERECSRFRALCAALADLVIVLDREGRIHSVEQTKCGVLYGPAEEMIGHTLHQVMPEYADRFVAEVRRALDARHPHDVEYCLDVGGENKWFEATFSPMSASTVFWVARDVTERKGLRATLAQAQKMEAVGRLAGGIAHDFSNILTAISGFGTLVANELPHTSPLRSDVEEILKAADRASMLTRQLLTFSRKEVQHLELVDVNRVVASLEPMLRRLLHEDLDLRIRLGMGVEFVRADRNQLEQVLLNLAINARDAMPAGGVLTIKTAHEAVKRTSQDERAEEENYVVLEVSDTGVGIDARIRDHLFEPFFTTKEPGRGTGLGLATVHGIVEQSGGFVSIQSEPHHGATFKVFLPQALGALPEARADERHGSGGDETILVVEDDVAIRALVQSVLTQWGYSVLVAANGSDALRVASESDRAIHLLLTDVVMPSLSGPALVAEIRRRHTDVRVLYMSGYPDSVIANQPVLDGATSFLPKPFTPERLLAAVRVGLSVERR